MTDLRLIYGHDPICGWCYAGIPAQRALARRFPDLPVELAMGGPFTGDRVVPYPAMEDYINRAFDRIEDRTGRRARAPFFRMIGDPASGDFDSTLPVHAVLQMRALAPDRLADYAHALQEAHYEQGRPFNAPEVFEDVARALGLPVPDGAAAVAATDDDPLIRAEYDRARGMGLVGYPTSFVVDGEDRVLGRIEGIYDPDAFVEAFEAIVARDETAAATPAPA